MERKFAALVSLDGCLLIDQKLQHGEVAPLRCRVKRCPTGRVPFVHEIPMLVNQLPRNIHTALPCCFVKGCIMELVTFRRVCSARQQQLDRFNGPDSRSDMKRSFLV